MNVIKFWTVFAIGVAAGAAVALIYAPQTGAKTRRQLKRNFNDASDYVKDASEQLGDHAERAVKRGRELWEDVADSASSAAKAAGKVAGQKLKDVADLV